ncbi:hypothetical protein [Aquipseudomonas campi]|uniref:hypothetical protein n=1 Tax=Aquipseudomonas campi TaxID=2731681 RepID=UPI001EFF538F|nr:hypothetical protein [Pseudomonas campi]
MNHAVHNKQVSFIWSSADDCLRDASGYVFYNTSTWTLSRLQKTATYNQQILLSNVEEYLDGFSDIISAVTGKIKVPGVVEPGTQDREVA